MSPQKEETNSTSESVPVLNISTEAFRKWSLAAKHPTDGGTRVLGL